MKRDNAVCPECGSTVRPYVEKIMGSRTMDLICADCKYTDHWRSFQKKESDSRDDEIQDIKNL